MEIVVRSFRFAADEDDEVMEAGFAEADDGSGFVLLIQRGLYESDEQDIALGMDTYCLVSGGKSIYGGLIRAVRKERGVDLVLSREAASLLALPANLELRLDGPPDDVAEILDGLPRIVDWGREGERPELVDFDGWRGEV
ncbi:Imm10 family immunity protein [Actinosynnema sp. CA-248983]